MLLAVAAWWIFYIPFRPKAPFDAIPDNACFIHVSKDPGARWAAIKNMPLLPALLSSNDFQAINTVAAFAGATSSTAPSGIGLTVVAYTPPSMLMPQGAWFAAAWMGARIHLPRLWFAIKTPKGFRVLDGCGSRAAWTSRNSVNSQGDYLSFAMADGLFIVCLSKDPAGIRFALATYDKLLPSFALSECAQEIIAAATDPGVSEQGWFKPNKAQHDVALRYAFARIDSTNIALSIHTDRPLPFAAPMRPASELTGMAELAGAAPALLAILQTDALQFLAHSLPATAFSFSLITLLHSDVLQTSNAPLLCAIAAAGNGAGFGKPPLRMPLPAALFAAPLGQKRENLSKALDASINLINNKHNNTLTLNAEHHTGFNSFYQIQAHKTDFLIQPDDSDLPAFATAGDWLIFGSSGSYLANLIDPSSQKNAVVKRNIWAPLMPIEPVALWTWLDLEKTGKTVEDALALWSAKLIWQEADRATLRKFATIKAAVHALRGMGHAVITARTSETNCAITLRIDRLTEETQNPGAF